MKSIKKFLFVMAALAAVWSFVSCSSDDDGPKTVAVYEAGSLGYTETITFYDDSTFENIGTISNDKYTFATGTYKGDVTKDTSDDNKVTYTIKKRMGRDGDDIKLLSIKDWIKYSYEGYDLDEAAIEKIIKDDFTDASATIEKGVLYCELGVYKKK